MEFQKQCNVCGKELTDIDFSGGIRIKDTICWGKDTDDDIKNYSRGLNCIMSNHGRTLEYPNIEMVLDGYGSLSTFDSAKKAQDLMRFNDRVESRIKEYVLQTTNITDELYEEKSRVEWYMFADEAKELGIVDYIIGEDCDIDEVC